jgi:hypothetical protein
LSVPSNQDSAGGKIKYMELLIIKSGNEYVRIKEDADLLVGLDKASVFPLERLETVQAHIGKLREQGFENLRIYKLKLSEEPFIQ